MPKKIKLVLVIMALGLFAATSVHAGWISSGKELGEWWSNTKARKQKVIPPELLYHIDADYSFGKTTGELESRSNNLDFTLNLRKDVVTSTTSYHFSDSSAERDHNYVTSSMQSLNEFAYAEVWSWIDIALGANWEKNDLKYIADSYYYFLGFDLTLIEYPV